WNGTSITNANVDDDLTISSSGSVDKGALQNSGTLSFDWVDSEVANDITIDSSNVVTAPYFVADDGAATSTFAGGLTIETSGFVYDFSSGNVGIGTSTPGSLLEIYSTAPYITLNNSTAEDSEGGRESKLIFDGIQSGGEAATLGEIEVNHSGTGDNTRGQMFLRTNDGTTLQDRLTLEFDEDITFGSSALGAKVILVSGAQNKQAYLQVDDSTAGSLIMSTVGAQNIEFWSNNGSNQNVVISSTGELGIGSSTPAVPLTVTTNPTFGSNVPVAWLHNEGNAANRDGTVISTLHTDTDVLDIRSGNTAWDTGTSLMLVEGGGNVGIGTTSPYARLSVVGEIVGAYYTATTTATSTFAGAIDVTEANATSTFAHGIDIGTGCLAVNGTCIGDTSGFFDTAGTGLTSSGSTVNVIGGVGITANADDIALDGTEIDAITWSDGVNASNIWTFDVSGTDTTATWGSALLTLSGALTINGTLSGVSALDSTTETTIESAIDTLGNLTSASALATVGTITSGVWSGTALVDAKVDNDITIDSSTVVTAPNFIADSGSATSTFAGGLTIETSGFVYDFSSNNVGIGTTTPRVKLTIDGATENMGSVTGPVAMDQGVAIYPNLTGSGQHTTNGTAAVMMVASDTNSFSTGIDQTVYIAGVNSNSDVTNNNSGQTSSVLIFGEANNLRNAGDNKGLVLIAGSTSSHCITSGGGISLIGDCSNLYLSHGGGVGKGHVIGDLGGLYNQSSGTGYNAAIGRAASVNANSGGATGQGNVVTIGEVTGVVRTSDEEILTIGKYSGSAITLSGDNSLTITGNTGRTNIASGYEFGGGSRGTNSIFLEFKDFEPLERLATGNAFGIGTSTPLAQLSASSTSLVTAIFDQRGTSDILQVQDSGSTVFVVKDGGNVGIGTTTPGSLLSIEGIANFTTATSTFYGNGLNITDGCFAIGGTCLPSTSFDGGTISNVILGPNGLVSAPTYSFSNDTDTGLYMPSTGWVALAAGGTLALQADNGGVYFGAGVARAGQITLIPGTESAPLYTFVGDNDTGIYSPSDETISFSTNGSEKVRIVSSGNVGIGTTSPYAKLAVAGEVVMDSFNATSTTATSTVAGNLQVDNNLQVGEGSTHIFGTGTSTFGGGITSAGFESTNGLTVSAGTTNLVNLILTGTITGSDVLSGTYLVASSASATSTFAGGLTVDGTKFVVDPDGGRVGIGTASPAYKLQVEGDIRATAGNIRVTNGGSASGSSMYSPASNELAFSTNSSEALRIDSSGNVGIGTTTPNATLNVHTADGGAMIPSVNADDLVIENNGNTGLTIFSPDASNAQIFLGSPSDTDAGLLRWNYDAKLLVLGTEQSSGELALRTGTGSEALRIDSSGNVGIGSTTPGSLLSIEGIANFTTATSTFYGNGLNIEDGCFAINGTCVGGTGYSAGDTILVADGALGSPGLGFQTDPDIGLYKPGEGDIGITSGGAVLARFVGSGGNQLRIVDGSVSAPGYAFLGSDGYQSGYWYPGSGDTAISAKSLEVIRFKDGGNVGIGTTSPWAHLSVNPNGITGPSFVIGSSTKTDFIVTNGGNVGIGTAVPEYTTEIVGGSSGVTTKILAIRANGTGNNTGSTLKFTNSTGGSSNIGSEITSLRTNVSSSGDSDLIFSTTAGSTMTERLRILADGNIGIGTTTPNATLNIHTADGGAMIPNANADDLVIENNAATGISILSSDSSGSNVYFGSPTDNFGARINWDHDDDLMILGTANSGASLRFDSGSGVEAMRIDSSGNVGIGTTSPSQLLEVSGSSPQISWLNTASSNKLWKIGMSGNDLRLTETGVADVMSLEAGGQVGIGVTSPDELLHVEKDQADGTIIHVENESTSDLAFAGADFKSDGSAGFLYNYGSGYSANIFGTTRANSFVLASQGTDDLRIGSIGDANLIFGQNNLEVMRIDTDGQVGIGTAAPNRLLTLFQNTGTVTNITPLRIQNDGAGDSGIQFQVGGAQDWSIGIDNSDSDSFKIAPSNDISDGLEVITILTGGNVGIGTSSPANPLSIESAASDLLNLNNSNNESTFSGGATKVGIDARIGDDNFIGSLDFRHNVTDSTATDFVIRLDAGSNSNNDRFFIDGDSGNVGIGTSTPGALLQVTGASAEQHITSTSGDSSLIIGDKNVATFGLKLRYDTSEGDVYFDNQYDNNSGDIFFRTKTSGTPVDALTITGAGNIGIGSTTPWALLAVNPNGISGPSFVIGSSTKTDFVVTNGGNVGIGIAAPSFALEVVGDGSFSTDLTIGDDILLGDSLLHTSDTDTFLDFNDDRIQLTAGGVNFMDIHETTQDILKINGDAADIDLLVSASGATNALFVEGSSGNVGIGNTAPGRELEVSDSASNAEIEISTWSTGDTNTSRLVLLKSSSATINTLSATAANEDLGSIVAQGVDTGSGVTEAAKILFEGDAAPDGDSVPGRISFFTSDLDDAGTPTERMRIDDAGRVGIGTTDPNNLLHIEVADSITNVVVGGLRLTHITSGTAAASFGTGIVFELEGADGSNLRAGNIDLIWTDASTGAEDSAMIFRTSEGGAVATEKLRIDSSGFVGIGSSTPNARLTVATPAASGTESAIELVNSTGSEFLRIQRAGSNAVIEARSALVIASDYDNDSTGAGSLITFEIDATEFLRLEATGYLGIGSTTPGSLLSIEGVANFTTGTSTFYGNGINIEDGCFAINGTCISGGGGGSGAFTSAGGFTTLDTSSDNVGINIASPESKLHIVDSGDSGQLRLNQSGDNDAVLGSGTNYFKIGVGTAGATVALTITHSNAYVGVSTTTPWALLSVEPDGISGPSFAIGSSTKTDFVVTNGGRVGIGTASPTETFQVSSANATIAEFTETGASAGTVVIRGSEGQNSRLNLFADQNDDSADGWGISSVASDNSLRFKNVAVGTDTLTLDNAGNVGIGNTLPGHEFEVSQSGSNSDIESSAWSTDNTHLAQLVLQKSSSATINTLAVTAAGESLGRILARGVDTGSGVAVAASIIFEGDAAPDADSVPGRIIFATSDADDAQTPTERMRIDDAGNVGIGTTSPDQLLTISKAGSAGGLSIERTDGSPSVFTLLNI
ncbi:hypothetical protein COB55_03855, partial [Candidatus Wolfebacteria bacterium]